MSLRLPLAVLAAAVVTGLGALVLGEYEFEGSLPFVAGPLFGLVIGELFVEIGRDRGVVAALLAALLAAAGIGWAGWIDSSQGLEPVKGLVWVGAGLAAVAALVRVLGRGRTRPRDPGGRS